MSSLASLEGYYFKPRMDRELLQTYGQGLIATTGCASGEIQTRMRLGQYDEAVEAAAEFRDIFGAENFYCEIMDHGLDIERRAMKRPAAAGQGPRPAAGGDQRPALHHGPRTPRPTPRCCACSPGSTLMDPNRFKFDADEFYLKSPAQMRHLLRELPEACDNTLLIAERCEVSFTEGERRLHAALPVPGGRGRDLVVRQGGRARPAQPLPRRHPGLRPQAGRLRDRGHRRQGLPRLLPRRRRLHQLGQEQRHPRRPRSRLGRRVDGGLRHAASPTSTRSRTA